jgi:hypothetical protein
MSKEYAASLSIRWNPRLRQSSWSPIWELSISNPILYRVVEPSELPSPPTFVLYVTVTGFYKLSDFSRRVVFCFWVKGLINYGDEICQLDIAHNIKILFTYAWMSVMQVFIMFHFQLLVWIHMFVGFIYIVWRDLIQSSCTEIGCLDDSLRLNCKCLDGIITYHSSLMWYIIYIKLNGYFGVCFTPLELYNRIGGCLSACVWLISFDRVHLYKLTFLILITVTTVYGSICEQKHTKLTCQKLIFYLCL